MPTYTYRCKDCQLEFDQFQSIMDQPLTVCPSCKGALRRVITGGSGLIFKGSGFYITDYKKKNSVGNKKSPKPAEKKENSSKKKD